MSAPAETRCASCSSSWSESEIEDRDERGTEYAVGIWIRRSVVLRWDEELQACKY